MQSHSPTDRLEHKSPLWPAALPSGMIATILVATVMCHPTRCFCQSAALQTAEAHEAQAPRPTPADWPRGVGAGEFSKGTNGEWLSPMIRAAFPFDEMIYSWNARLRPHEGFRLYLKVAFGSGDESPWLYAGYWGAVNDLAATRAKPMFDRGELDMDWLRLKQRAASYQFKVVEAGVAPLCARPSLSVVTTDDHPSAETSLHRDGAAGGAPATAARVLDIPLRRQVVSDGTVTPNRCQSAALASAMEYFGVKVPLQDIISLAYDREYAYPGIWPRVIGAANRFGFSGAIDRFRDWSAVRAALAANRVILCSIRLRKGECTSPPYEEIGDHIVALNGVTDDGRVVVTDSYLGRSGRGYRCQWLREDFERVWMINKNGVGLVIYPPAGAKQRTVAGLPPFPSGRALAVGDDH